MSRKKIKTIGEQLFEKYEQSSVKFVEHQTVENERAYIVARQIFLGHLQQLEIAVYGEG